MRTEESEAAFMEYIHRNNGSAILIRQNLLTDKNEDLFCEMFWHKLGRFYAINSESIPFHHYSDPGKAAEGQRLPTGLPCDPARAPGLPRL